MNSITALSNLFSGSNLSKLVNLKMDNLISGANSLNKLSGVPKGAVEKIEKIGDDQVSRFERIFAAHTRAHAVNEMVSRLMSIKDSNGDGMLNVGELGIPEDTFDMIDKNSDGQVGKAEINAAFHARIQAMSERTNHLITKKDTNGDGMLNVEELGVPEEIFNKIDKNGDGQADRVELSIAARTHAALNNMISEILPPEKSSKLDATV